MDTRTPTGPDEPTDTDEIDLRRRRVDRRRLGITLVAVVTALLAVATVVSFLGDPDDVAVTSLDPDATSPVNGLTDGVDLVGTELADLDYTTFDGTVLPLRPAGRPLLINFWSSTCAPCVREMPAIQQLSVESAGAIDILGLDYVEVPELGRRMIEATGVTYPMGRDPKGLLLRELGGNGLPYTVVVAADGTIVATHGGELELDEFRALVQRAQAN